MRKFILLLISLAIATPTFAQETNWEASPYDQNATSSQETTPEYSQEETQPQLFSKDKAPRSRHNISVEYGFLNISDFGWAIASAIGGIFSGEEKEIFFLGDIGINYGYEVGELFETGVIVNFALPEKDLFFATIMPRAKLNFNQGGFVNPYMELDAGIIISSSGGAMPMLHGTLLGLEIGYFYMQLAGWGQRGLWYAGIKIPL